MFATFFITLREGLEAALIVGIIAAYLAKVGRRDMFLPVGLGVALAVGICVVAGIAVVATVGRLPLQVQATIEGLGALTAVDRGHLDAVLDASSGSGHEGRTRGSPLGCAGAR